MSGTGAKRRRAEKRSKDPRVQEKRAAYLAQREAEQERERAAERRRKAMAEGVQRIASASLAMKAVHGAASKGSK